MGKSLAEIMARFTLALLLFHYDFVPEGDYLANNVKTGHGIGVSNEMAYPMRKLIRRPL